MRQPLSQRQQQILTFVREFVAARHIAPTYADIALNLGIRSLGTVSEHMTALERKGYIRRGRYEQRGIVIIPDRDEAAAIIRELCAQHGWSLPVEFGYVPEHGDVPNLSDLQGAGR